MDVVCQLLDICSHLVETPPYLINSDEIKMYCLQWNILLEVSMQIVLQLSAECRRLLFSQK